MTDPASDPDTITRRQRIRLIRPASTDPLLLPPIERRLCRERPYAARTIALLLILFASMLAIAIHYSGRRVAGSSTIQTKGQR